MNYQSKLYDETIKEIDQLNEEDIPFITEAQIGMIALVSELIHRQHSIHPDYNRAVETIMVAFNEQDYQRAEERAEYAFSYLYPPNRAYWTVARRMYKNKIEKHKELCNS